MTRPIDVFIRDCTRFARLFPDAVMAMPEPELAVDPRARAHHLRSTCERARERMRTTAELALESRHEQPDLFAAQQMKTTQERVSA